MYSTELLYAIACGEHAEARRVAEARIAALEATVARLTAPVTDGEVVDMVGTYLAMKRGREAGRAALTAFLERRMKG